MFVPAAFELPYSLAERTNWPALYQEHAFFIVNKVFFWLTIYFVKFSFLALYRRLFDATRAFGAAWWTLTLFTSSSLTVSIALSIWQCRGPRDTGDVLGCDALWAVTVSQIPGLWVPGSLHLATDLAIVALALWQLRRLKLQCPPQAKLDVALLLFLVAVITALDLARITVILYGQASGTPSGEWTVFEALEPPVAVILSALAAYGKLFSYMQAESELEMGLGGRDAAPPATRQTSRRATRIVTRMTSRRQSQNALDNDDDGSFFRTASPIERHFFRLWVLFAERHDFRDEVAIEQTEAIHTGHEPGNWI